MGLGGGVPLVNATETTETIMYTTVLIFYIMIIFPQEKTHVEIQG